MTIRQYVWLDDPNGEDEKAIAYLRTFGVREIARQTDISPSMICRWLAGRTGMDLQKVRAVFAAAEEHP